MYKLKELTNDEFDEFSKNYNISTVYQTSQYALTMNNQDYDSILLGLVDSNDIIQAATLILITNNRKFKFAYSPRGYLIDYRNEELVTLFTRFIKEYLNKNNVVTLKINPPIFKTIYYIKENNIYKNNYYDHILNFLISLGYKHLGYNSYFEGIRPRFEAVINLESDEKDIFDNLKRELKTKIRNAKKTGIKIIKGNDNDLNILYDQIKIKYPRNFKYLEDTYKFFKKNNSIDFYYTKLDTVKYLQETGKSLEEKENEVLKINNKIQSNNSSNKNISKKMNMDLDVYKYNKQLVEATKLLKEYPDGLITSSALIAKYKDEVTLLIDGHNKLYKNLNAKHLLIWELCKIYKKEGYKKFNLGGIANINIDDNKYKGLNNFKQSFNPYIIEYMGDLEIITNSSLYFMYSNSIALKNIIKK